MGMFLEDFTVVWKTENGVLVQGHKRGEKSSGCIKINLELKLIGHRLNVTLRKGG